MNYEPPFPSQTPGYNLRQAFRAPVAIDEDGTLIAVNNGYVPALRPLLADFNGDGCATTSTWTLSRTR